MVKWQVTVLERLKGRKILMEILKMGSAIAQRISLCLPSSRRRFKSQAQHLHFFNSVSNCILNLSSYCEKDKNKQKEAGVGQFPIFEKYLMSLKQAHWNAWFSLAPIAVNLNGVFDVFNADWISLTFSLKEHLPIFTWLILGSYCIV